MVKEVKGDSNWKIRFIGDAQVRQVIERYQGMGVKCISYIGETNQPYAWMKAADYLLLPSRWEGLPMVVLEALKLGTKVIASDTANINDLVDNRNVWLYKQGDVGSFTETVTHCGAQRKLPVTIDMEKYSLDYVGECLRKFYKSIIHDS